MYSKILKFFFSISAFAVQFSNCQIIPFYFCVSNPDKKKKAARIFTIHILGCISLGNILIQKRIFCFFGKIQKGIINPMNPYAMKIQWINPNADS